MDPKPNEAEIGSQPPPGEGDPESADSKHWSPFSTSRARWAWGLMAVYSVIYFAVAVLTSAEFAELAAEHNCELHDVRKPSPDLTVSEGVAGDVDAEVILTVGTDCSVGKMTATLELCEAARERGVDAAFIPTGQTGIMIEGWGNPTDRVISDFTAGAVEEMILEKSDHDYLFVEGQGSIVHPAYSAVTCGILHGSMPDKLVLCHEAGREAIHGYEEFPLPALPDYVDLYENLAGPVHDADVVAGALNTRSLETDEGARSAVDAYSRTLSVPASDPIRFGNDELLEALL